MGIEVCMGKAMMDGNMKIKTYNQDYLYVVNHETDTIYNDVVKFGVGNLKDAEKQFLSYP